MAKHWLENLADLRRIAEEARKVMHVVHHGYRADIDFSDLDAALEAWFGSGYTNVDHLRAAAGGAAGPPPSGAVDDDGDPIYGVGRGRQAYRDLGEAVGPANDDEGEG